MASTIERPKWILDRHTNNFDLLCEIAQSLKSYSRTVINKTDITQLNLHLKEQGLYNERNPQLPLDAIYHKIHELAYYMFGYKVKENGISRFMFSPLGNLLLRNLNNSEHAARIFLCMVWAVQFPHQHGGTDWEFQLYPFRLIYKLLCDERLDFRLYAYEVAYFVVFTKTIDTEIYEELVRKLLSLRTLDDETLTAMLLKDCHAYVNSAYEWDYYVSALFSSAGILEKNEGCVICKLKQGTGTFRKVTRNYVSIPTYLKDLINELESEYSFLDRPLRLDDPERLREDVVKEVYSFYPSVLIRQIGGREDMATLLSLPKMIEKYSLNPDNETAHKFEDVLVDGFNMFYNVEAKGIGGAGQTDIECLYIGLNRKFAVESKSTQNKLLSINIGRLREHREKIGGEYTIVVTPRYVPAAKRDIKDTPNVILLASTFAEYLYNCIESDIRDIDYGEFDGIIMSNLGGDISPEVNRLTISKFSAGK